MEVGEIKEIEGKNLRQVFIDEKKMSDYNGKTQILEISSDSSEELNVEVCVNPSNRENRIVGYEPNGNSKGHWFDGGDAEEKILEHLREVEVLKVEKIGG